MARVTKVREYLDDDVPLMVDANQQWDRATAQRMGRIFEEFGLVWIEEPLDAYDAEGHANLARSLDTPIATGEMLASVAEHVRLIEAGAADIVQPDAPRIGGITQFLKLATIAEAKQLEIAPHFAMEIHCHLAAAYSIEPWVEHFDWLDPLFNEHLEIRDGRMWVSERPGLGFTLSEQADAWTIGTAEFGTGETTAMHSFDALVRHVERFNLVSYARSLTPSNEHSRVLENAYQSTMKGKTWL